ncbi:hypothetical protein CsatA_009757 [Cannabis sativa]
MTFQSQRTQNDSVLCLNKTQGSRIFSATFSLSLSSLRNPSREFLSEKLEARFQSTQKIKPQTLYTDQIYNDLICTHPHTQIGKIRDRKHQKFPEVHQ